MFQSFRQNWDQLRKGKPGSRFEDQHSRNHKKPRARRTAPALNIAAGGSIMLVGLFMVPAPGPGWAVVFAGGAILAREFLFVARALDRLEVLFRKLAHLAKKYWAVSPIPLKMLAVAVAIALSGTGIYVTWRIFGS